VILAAFPESAGASPPGRIPNGGLVRVRLSAGQPVGATSIGA
jgi:hypothetical protein